MTSLLARIRRRAALPRRVRDEDGASLILALLFLTIVGLVVAALLPYAGVGISTSGVAANIRSIQGAADGAVEGAIGSIRYSATKGTSSVPCPTYTPPAYPQPIGSPLNFSVTCQAEDNAGGAGPPDQPQFAIIALDSSAAAAGINLSGHDPGGITINGGLFSAKNISTGSQTTVLNGDVFAKGTCDPQITVTGTGVEHCPVQAGDPTGADPGYGSVIGPTLGSDANWMLENADPPGTCSSTTSVVTFTPGYYSQPPTPDPVSCAGNPDTVLWFNPGAGPDPGVYYFDFADSTVGLSGAAPVWSRSGSPNIVVGGTPDGWTSSTPAATVAALAVGGLCDPDQLGVQFVFGGPTSFDESGSGSSGPDLELCGSQANEAFTGSGQHISVFGLPTAAGAARTATTPPDFVPATATSLSAPAFATSAGATMHGDGSVAQAPLTSNNKTATLTISQFPTTPATPFPPGTSSLAGAAIKTASLLIWHQETAHDQSPQVTVTLGSGTQIGPQAIPTSNTLANPAPAIDLTAAIKADAAKQPYPWRDLQGISVSYSDSSSGGSKNSDNDQVDGVELKVTYEAPALEGTRCDKQTGGICPILTNDKSSTIILPGTAYAPSASFDVTTFNKGAEAEGLIFHRGVIAQDVTLNINGSSHKQTEAPFQLPGTTTFRKVLFTAKNTADGHVYLRALVQFVDSIDDDTGAAVLQPGASVKIVEWTVLR